MIKSLASEDAIQRMLGAYEFFKTFPSVKEALDGREQKIGLLEIDYCGHPFHLGWLMGVGMAWYYWSFDMFYPEADKNAQPQNVKDYIVSAGCAMQNMATVGLLAMRGHRIAQEIIRKKVEKARAAANKIGFDSDRLEDAWCVYYHLSSPHMLVFSTSNDSAYVGVPPRNLFFIGYGQTYKLRLLDVYRTIARHRPKSALEMVADTTEKRVKLLIQMLIEEKWR